MDHSGFIVWNLIGNLIGQIVFVAVVERLPAFHYSVDFIFLSFGTMGFIVEL